MERTGEKSFEGGSTSWMDNKDTKLLDREKGVLVVNYSSIRADIHWETIYRTQCAAA